MLGGSGVLVMCAAVEVGGVMRGGRVGQLDFSWFLELAG